MTNSLMAAVLAVFALVSCNSQQKKEEKKTELDTPTSGEIRISVDESFKPLVEAEIKVFEESYPDAHIVAAYKPESEAFRDLMNDSARLIFSSRDFTPAERQEFEAAKHQSRSIVIAYDGIAIIANPNSTLASLSREDLKNILSGKISTWKQLPGQTSKDTIKVVFDHQGSGTVRYLKDSLLGASPFSRNCFAVSSNPQVIDYVETNNSALGVIGVSWISDLDDTMTHTFLDKVKVLEIKNKAGEAYSPHKGHVAQRVYPLWRNLYIVSREARTGLGTGFASFVAGDRGQRIVLKAGLVPATMPVRLIITGE